MSKSAAFNDVSDPMMHFVVSVGRVHVIAVLDRNLLSRSCPAAAATPPSQSCSHEHGR